MQLLIHLFLTLFLESITRCSPSGLWTGHTWATRLQDRAESVYFGALLAGLLLVPQHRSPPGIFPLKNYLITSNLGMCWRLARLSNQRGLLWGSENSLMAALRLAAAEPPHTRAISWVWTRMGIKLTLPSTSSEGHAFKNLRTLGLARGRSLWTLCSSAV